MPNLTRLEGVLAGTGAKVAGRAEQEGPMGLNKKVTVRFRSTVHEPGTYGDLAGPRLHCDFRSVLRAGVEHGGAAFFITQDLGRGGVYTGGIAQRVTYFPSDIVQSMVVEDE